eukprot:2139688-Amphidinium_carterae.1
MDGTFRRDYSTSCLVSLSQELARGNCRARFVPLYNILKLRSLRGERYAQAANAGGAWVAQTPGENMDSQGVI